MTDAGLTRDALTYADALVPKVTAGLIASLTLWMFRVSLARAAIWLGRVIRRLVRASPHWITKPANALALALNWPIVVSCQERT